jgi:hypothetical protein
VLLALFLTGVWRAHAVCPALLIARVELCIVQLALAVRGQLPCLRAAA